MTGYRFQDADRELQETRTRTKRAIIAGRHADDESDDGGDQTTQREVFT